jgi:hypothetical protein
VTTAPGAGLDRTGERAVWSLVWLGVITAGVDSWGSWSSWSAMAYGAPLIVAAGLAGLALTWTLDDPTSRLMTNVGMGVGALSVALTRGVEIVGRQFYTTDSAAFNHVATRLLLHGHNPYTSSMGDAATLLSDPAHYWTYLTNGGHVTGVSYPAGSFLLQAPLVALGVHHLASDWLDLGAWIGAGIVLFLLLPKSLRWIAPLLLLTDAFTGSFASGGTDALFIPFLVLALWRWDRFVTPHAGLERWLSPVALGVACSIKQSPWFVVPFVVLGVALEARRATLDPWRSGARYGALVAGTFLVVNLPFIVASPTPWLRGVLLPLRSPLVPDGQGLVTLALHGATGGASLELLNLAALIGVVGLLIATYRWYPQLKRAWLFILPVVLFIPGRSLTNYLLDLFPAALIAATSVRAAPTAAPARRTGYALGVAGAGAAACVAWAFLAVPLGVTVQRVATADHHLAITAITLRLENRTNHAVDPHFMMSVDGGHPSGFWLATTTEGSLPLAPGARATVVIRPPEWIWAPARGDAWLVSAYSDGPSALSTSSVQHWPYGPTPTRF